ncbi:MAG TPA: macro domain-containing protein [Dehalococcoidia bacterium]|nr:macro domain-containing protein [Dehalococcoidia bacterium]
MSAGARVLASYRRPDGRVLEAVQGDITQEKTDVIVNAANERLSHGGGVAGAIVRRGGREIQEESDRWVRQHGPVPTGGAAITGAGRLKARYVVHAVGPRWGMGHEEALLARAVHSALQRADEVAAKSVALPAISTGIFGFPKEAGVRAIVRAVQDYLDSHPESPIARVRLCDRDPETASLFAQTLEALASTHG